MSGIGIGFRIQDSGFGIQESEVRNRQVGGGGKTPTSRPQLFFPTDDGQLTTDLPAGGLLQDLADGLLHQGTWGSEPSPDFELTRALRHQHFKAADGNQAASP